MKKKYNDMNVLIDDLERYKLLVDTFNQATWETDASGQVVKDSPSWRTYTGQTYEEWIGYGWLNAVHPDDREYAERQWKEAVTAGRKVNEEFRIKSPDGGWRWTNVLASPIYDHNGNIMKWIGININIHEKKNAEIELLETKEKSEHDHKRLESILDALPSAVVLIEQSTEKFLYINKRALDLYGLNYVGYDLESHLFRVKALKMDGTPYPFEEMPVSYALKYGQEVRNREMIIERADGTQIPIMVSASPLFNTKGQVDSAIVIFEDISELKKTEEALKDSEKKYGQILETSYEGIILVDKKAKIYYFNDSALRICGYNKEELLRRSIFDLLTNESIREGFEFLEKQKSGNSGQYELRGMKKDGSLYWLLINASPFFDKEGNYDGSLLMFSDVTERKEFEQKLIEKEKEYLEILDGTFLGSFIVDFNKKEGYISETWKKRVGLDILSPTEIFVENSKAVHPEDIDFVKSIVSDGIKDQKSKLKFECRIKTVDSGYIWVLEQTKVIYNEEGKPVKSYGTHIDITDRKKVEEELKNNLNIQDQMFSNVSHELRTPLNVLLGAIQLMEKQNSDETEKTKNLLGAMKQNCYRLIRLVNNIIDVSKIDSDNMNKNLKNYNIVALVEEITLSIADFAESKGVKLVFDTDEEEINACVDADFIERIMLNLLSNSLKFTNNGGNINISIHNKKENVLISVKDSGEGIPADKLDIIFSRYGQVSKDLNRRNEGTGIGLHLTKKLVEILGGRISVYSKLNEGTDFIIELPVKPKEETSADQPLFSNLAERIKIELSDIYKMK
jgi:PAS domain S-box-containing protein